MRQNRPEAGHDLRTCRNFRIPARQPGSVRQQLSLGSSFRRKLYAITVMKIVPFHRKDSRVLDRTPSSGTSSCLSPMTFCSFSRNSCRPAGSPSSNYFVACWRCWSCETPTYPNLYHTSEGGPNPRHLRCKERNSHSRHVAP